MDDQEKAVEEKIGQEAAKEPAINKSFTFDKTRPLSYEQKSSRNPGKILLIISILLVIAVIVFLFKSQVKTLVVGTKPTPAPAQVVAQPVPAPNPLVRSEWSFEVLNGSGAAGLAKTMADKISSLGYQVVKVGNADKSNYAQTEILVKKDLQDKVDLVVADLKDAVKIASVAGELTEGTASARIILGKDSI